MVNRGDGVYHLLFWRKAKRIWVETKVIKQCIASIVLCVLPQFTSRKRAIQVAIQMYLQLSVRIKNYESFISQTVYDTGIYWLMNISVMTIVAIGTKKKSLILVSLQKCDPMILLKLLLQGVKNFIGYPLYNMVLKMTLTIYNCNHKTTIADISICSTTN